MIVCSERPREERLCETRLGVRPSPLGGRFHFTLYAESEVSEVRDTLHVDSVSGVLTQSQREVAEDIDNEPVARKPQDVSTPTLPEC